MNFNEYQQQAHTTCMPSSNNIVYMTWNLAGEVGELLSKLAKALRHEKITVNDNQYEICGTPLTEEHVKNLKQLTSEEQDAYCQKYVEKTMQEDKERQEALKLEAGDILWQLSGLCTVMGWSLEEIARLNLDKLADRKKRDKIDGDGDNR